MHWVQVLKGWLFIIIVGAALFFLGVAMERRHQGSIVKQQPNIDSPTSSPTENHESKDPVQSEETTSKIIEPTQPLTDTNLGEALPEDEAAKTMAAPKKAPAEVIEKTEDPQSEQPILAESTSFIDPEQASPDASAEVTDSTGDIKEGTPPVAIIDPPAMSLSRQPLYCDFLDTENGEKPRASLYRENTMTLIWEQFAPAPVKALLNGAVVRIFDSPYTGKTVYQTSDDGRLCIVYGHLDAVRVDLVAGQRLTCEEAFAQTQKGQVGANFSLQIMAIPTGASWWQGQPIEPIELLPDWIPAEPEEEPEVP